MGQAIYCCDSAAVALGSSADVGRIRIGCRVMGGGGYSSPILNVYRWSPVQEVFFWFEVKG